MLRVAIAGLYPPDTNRFIATLVEKDLEILFFPSLVEWLESESDCSCMIVFDQDSTFDFRTLIDHFCARQLWIPIIAVLKPIEIRRSIKLIRMGIFDVLPWDSNELACIEAAIDLVKNAPQPILRLSQAMKSFYSLDDAERQVLSLLMSGLRNKQISTRLELGLRTIELRKQRILQKFGAENIALVIREVSWIELATGWNARFFSE